MTRIYRRTPPEQRFWQKVSKGGPDECWNWTAAVNKYGYGHFGFSAAVGMIRAHRYAFELTNGEIPHGAIVRHRCDNRLCVNPAHLELGTAADNVADMMARGRQRNRPLKGAENGSAKLSPETVLEIRRRLANGATDRGLARDIGVGKSTVRRIRTGQSWAHI
jgi:hypothetical protein